MKYAVIDVGSNSVRLMFWENKTIYKRVNCTRLAENLQNGFLDFNSVERTVNAVVEYFNTARANGADKVFIFGTAALRKAKNSDRFTEEVKKKTGLSVDIISGEKEAEIGALGALCGRDGGVIDIGGASSETVVISNGKVVFVKSADIGAVTLHNECGDDENSARDLISEKISVYGDIPKTEFYAIGGTATSLASVSQSLFPYDPEKVQGYKLAFSEVERLKNTFYSMTESERENVVGLQKERAKVIASGTHILYEIMKKSGLDSVTVSESDNLEGYLLDRMNNEKKF